MEIRYLILTELPMVTNVSVALWTLFSPTFTAKALVICDENSTEIPTAITKLTSETAFKVICHLKRVKNNNKKKLFI